MGNEAGIQKECNGIKLLVKDKRKRKAWISEDTLRIIENRRELHKKNTNTKSERIKVWLKEE